MNLKIVSCFATLLLVAMAPRPAHAVDITINDYSFEDQTVTPGGWGTLNPQFGWTKDGGGAGPQWFTGTSPFYTPQADPVQGNQVEYVNNSGSIFQDVGLLAADTTYTLTIAVGNRLDQGNGQNGGIIELVNGTTDKGTILAQSANFIPIAGYFQDLQITFTTGDSVSDDLTIVLKETGNNTAFDNVRLTATAVPEPSTWGLLTAAMLAMGPVARRKTKGLA